MSAKHVTVFSETARTQLRLIERGVAMRILRKLADLEHDPYGYDTTALVGHTGVRRLRVGDYRVIYVIGATQLRVYVIEVGHRARVYD